MQRKTELEVASVHAVCASQLHLASPAHSKQYTVRLFQQSCVSSAHAAAAMFDNFCTLESKTNQEEPR